MQHRHGAVEPALSASSRAIRAVKWSFVGLLGTAALQALVVALSGSVALLADTIHNVGDSATAIPLWIAFALARRPPSKRFTYGFGRVEALAGVAIVVVILLSALVAGYQSYQRLVHPQSVTYLWAVAAAAVAGFLGNEAVAIYRIRMGRETGSAALVADGYHARADGLVSLAVAGGAFGIWLGFPLTDPIVGLLITVAILALVWSAGKGVFLRLLDGVEPDVVEEIRHAAQHATDVSEVSEVRVRWLGHRLHAEVNVAVPPGLSVERGHEVAGAVRHQLMHHLKYLAGVTVHVDPASASGEAHHRIADHTHDGLPSHSH